MQIIFYVIELKELLNIKIDYYFVYLNKYTTNIRIEGCFFVIPKDEITTTLGLFLAF
jgi:hypothetical protein